MRIGNVVTYRDSRGGNYPATVTNVVGSGESGYKLLDLEYFLDSERFAPQSVPHVGDAHSEDADYWYLGEHVAEPPAAAYADASVDGDGLTEEELASEQADNEQAAWEIANLRDVVPSPHFPDS